MHAVWPFYGDCGELHPFGVAERGLAKEQSGQFAKHRIPEKRQKNVVQTQRHSNS
jgi:hypothetical protein